MMSNFIVMQKIILEGITIDEFRSLLKEIIQEHSQINTKKEGEILLSTEEARKVWQPAISKVTLHRWTQNGLIPVHRIGGRVYYKRSEIINASKTFNKYGKY